jgi:glutamate 5-kinase
LLTVGIIDVRGSFSAGEVVQLIDEEESIIGVAKVKLDAVHMAQQLSDKHVLAAHSDDIVIF